MTDASRGLETETVSTDYVNLERRIDVQDIGALITNTLTANGEHPVMVRVIDEFPAEASISKTRFVPEFEPREGSIDNAGVVFEVAVPVDEPVVIKYGVRIENSEMASAFSAPRIDLAQPIDEVTADVVLRGAGTAEILDSISDDTHGPSPTSPVTVRSPGSAPELPELEADESEGVDVLPRLIAELRHPSVSDGKVDALRDELMLEHPRSMDVKLRYIQSRVNQYEAYADALEAFIDRYGTPVDIADAVTREHERIFDELEEIREAFTDAEAERDAFRTRIDDLRETTAALETELSDEIAAILEQSVERYESLDERLRAIETEAAAIEDRLAEIEGEIRRIEGRFEEEIAAIKQDLEIMVEGLKASATEEVQSLADDVEENYDALADDIESLESDVQEDLEALNATVAEDLEAFRLELDAAEDELETVQPLLEDVEENTTAREQFSTFLESIQSLNEETNGSRRANGGGDTDGTANDAESREDPGSDTGAVQERNSDEAGDEVDVAYDTDGSA